VSHLCASVDPLEYLFCVVTVYTVQAAETRGGLDGLEFKSAYCGSVPAWRAVYFVEKFRPPAVHGKIHELVKGICAAGCIRVVVAW